MTHDTREDEARDIVEEKLELLDNLFVRYQVPSPVIHTFIASISEAFSDVSRFAAKRREIDILEILDEMEDQTARNCVLYAISPKCTDCGKIINPDDCARNVCNNCRLEI